MKTNLFFSLFCVLSQLCFSQTSLEKVTVSSHTLTMGLGFFEYNNSNTIPYGMNGSSFNFRYRLYKHNLKTGHDFRYDVYFDYSGLGNPYIIDKDLVLFNYFGFNTGAGWMRPIINGIEGLGVNVGFGVNIDGEYILPTEEANALIGHPINFGKWLVSSPCLIRINYSLKSFSLTNSFQLPLIGFGYFPEYQYSPSRLDEHYYSYFMKPNTIAYLGNYRLIDNEFDVSYPLGKTTVNLSYAFTTCNYIVNNNSQHYLQHSIGLGVTF